MGWKLVGAFSILVLFFLTVRVQPVRACSYDSECGGGFCMDGNCVSVSCGQCTCSPAPPGYNNCVPNGNCISQRACCTASCGGGGGGSETCLGQPKPGGYCSSWCRGAQNCYQQESGWWCEDAGWVGEGNANSWSACSPSCGNGQQTNECGTTRNCSNGPCCTNSAPLPYLSSPPENQKLSGSAVTLSWGVQTWGMNCSGNNNSLIVYVQECPAFMDPTTVYSVMPASQTSINYFGQPPKSYCWAVSASNGALSAKTSPRRWTFSDTSWWQVKDGGVMAGGNITSKVNTGQTLIVGESAVVAANGAIDLNNQNASTTNWQAQNAIGVISSKLNYRYDYDSVYSRVYAHIKRTEISNGWDLYNSGIPTGSNYNYVHVTGDLNTREDLNIGTNKLIILVEGNANLNHNINFDDNLGLFALYVKGNINIDPTVGTGTGTGVDPETLTANLEGIFLASGSINTGTGTKQLRIEGPIIGIGGVNFQRNLYSIWPNEFIVFRPDILMNLPKPLLRQNNLWMEKEP